MRWAALLQPLAIVYLLTSLSQERRSWLIDHSPLPTLTSIPYSNPNFDPNDPRFCAWFSNSSAHGVASDFEECHSQRAILFGEQLQLCQSGGGRSHPNTNQGNSLGCCCNLNIVARSSWSKGDRADRTTEQEPLVRTDINSSITILKLGLACLVYTLCDRRPGFGSLVDEDAAHILYKLSSVQSIVEAPKQSGWGRSSVLKTVEHPQVRTV